MAIHGKASFLLPCLSIVILFAGLAFPEPACAQVVTDGSLGGPKGPVGSGTIPGVGTTTYHITDSLGKRAGQNLFHSFSTFNVGTGESATFTGPGGIQNIVSRVTGGSNSWIDGTLRSTIQGANLYFLNPWGIVFGPNASLDVRGSFHVSTADYLRFEDGLRFSSVPSPADQVLSTASPVAFGFLNANPAPVYVAQSFLEVPAGETLSIISGEIDLYGAYLRAPGGQINLASMFSPGEVIPGPATSLPDLLVQPGRASGPIGVHGSVVDVRGTPSGTVLIRSGRLVLDQVSWVTADNYGDTGGGSIDARVESLDVLGESGLSADTYGGAQSGGVHIVTGSLEISQGGFVSSDSQGSGTGGPVTIEATESVHLSDSLSRVSSAGWASGDAGTVALTTPDLLMENEALIFGDSSGGGKGGDVSILTGKLRLLSGSAVSSDSLGPTGNGGNLFISATESIDISGTGPSDLPSRVANRTAGAGNAGRIEVVTPILSLGDSATIGAETIGAGRAGDIDITVGILNLTGGGMMSNSAFGTTGTGGNITIRASDSVMISGSSPLGIWSGLFSYAWWEGQGDAGNISVSTPNLTLSNLGSIGADTVGDARGGNIELAVQRLSLSDGGNISSGSHGGSGRGGDIHVSASDKVLETEGISQSQPTLSPLRRKGRFLPIPWAADREATLGSTSRP
jgi:filamentous hemagglutinin family protein